MRYKKKKKENFTLHRTKLKRRKICHTPKTTYTFKGLRFNRNISYDLEVWTHGKTNNSDVSGHLGHLQIYILKFCSWFWTMLQVWNIYFNQLEGKRKGWLQGGNWDECKVRGGREFFQVFWKLYQCDGGPQKIVKIRGAQILKTIGPFKMTYLIRCVSLV